MTATQDKSGHSSDDWSRTASGLARAIGSDVRAVKGLAYGLIALDEDCAGRVSELLSSAQPSAEVIRCGRSSREIKELRMKRPGAVVVGPSAASRFGATLMRRLSQEAAAVPLVVLVSETHASTEGRLAFITAGAHAVAAWDGLGADELAYTLEAARLRHEPYHRLERMAYIDGLTDLPNRASIPIALEEIWQRAREMRRMATIILVDLAGFRLLNDTLGHQVGDEVLKSIARRLQAQIDAGEFLARWDGDTFLVSSIRPRDALTSREVARSILHELEQPVEVEGQSLFLSYCAGVATSETETDPSTVMRQADIALSQAKALGHGTISSYDPARGTEVRQQLEMWSSLRRAVRDQQFELHYQPQVALSDGSITGVEALLRWRRDDGELISPVRFIPLLERGRLISEVGAWILGQACEDMRRWDEVGLSVPFVSVNISPFQLRDTRLLDSAARLGADQPEFFRRLRAELTESAVVESDGDERANLDALVAAGLHFALDDFGTGFASILQLAQLPIDTLKIDRSLVAAMHDSTRVERVMESIVSLARVLELGLIAEGVETAQEWQLLRAQGVDCAQGYFIARPMPAVHLPNWAQRWQAPA